MMKHCTNNAAEKAAVIKNGMQSFGDYTGMVDLYRRGCFRHLEDVAYARIMLERGTLIDDIADDLDSSYEGPRARMHHCDRVYPPS